MNPAAFSPRRDSFNSGLIQQSLTSSGYNYDWAYVVRAAPKYARVALFTRLLEPSVASYMLQR